MINTFKLGSMMCLFSCILICKSLASSPRLNLISQAGEEAFSYTNYLGLHVKTVVRFQKYQLKS